MKIFDCTFKTPCPGGGEITGHYSDGKVRLSGVSNTTRNNKWTGSRMLPEQKQKEYLELLKSALQADKELFI